MGALLRRNKKMIIITAAVIVGLFQLFIILSFISPIFMLANEGDMLKEQLSNPYIDSKYKEWKEVEIENWGSCLLPNEWYVSSYDGIISVTNKNGEMVAEGTILDSKNSFFASREAFLTELSGFDITKISFEYAEKYVSIKSSYLGIISGTGDKEISYGFFSLRKIDEDGSSELFIVFPKYAEENKQAVINVAQAISFSHSFPDDCRQ